MFEGQRLSYLVPGYTGHIPKKTYENEVPIQKKQGSSHIPGYAGHVHSIKSENIYGSTFGKTTLDINSNNFPKGQDFASKQKYVSTHTRTNIPPSQMFRKTAADIVGVPNKEIKLHEPNLQKSTGPQTDQFTFTKTEEFKQSVRNRQNPWIDNSVEKREGKQYVKLKDPLPGYTGFGKRVLANNIFGKTFAECRNQSLQDADKLDHERKHNFNSQLKADIPFKF